MRPATLSTTRQRWQAAAGPWRGFLTCPALFSPSVEAVLDDRRVRCGGHPPPPWIKPLPRRSGEGVFEITPPLPLSGSGGAGGGVGRSSEASVGRSPKRTRRSPLPRQVAALKEQLRGELAGGGVLCVLDLEPGLGIQVAAELRIAAVANAVIVIPRWPYAEAVLPVSQLLWTLASQARRLPTDDRRLPSAVFVLDNQRSRGLTRPTPDRRADNRYALGPGDLPSFATLRERGIRRILKLTNP